MKKILLLPHLKVHNANALSSAYTIGFPAMTAWLGAMHALQRKLNQRGYSNLRLTSVAVVSHECNLQVYKDDKGFDYKIIVTANPLIPDKRYKKKYGDRYKDKWEAPFTRSAFVAEARCHLDVSLIIECEGLPFNEQEFLDDLPIVMHSGWKIAGGDIESFETPKYFVISNESDHKKLMRQVMPGYVLVERRKLMMDAMKNGMDAIDALLEFVKIKHRSEQKENGEIEWTSSRSVNGWIVPVATGFQGLTELGKAKNQRDPNVLHRFAESVVTLGEFIMPYRIKNLDDMLWHYHVDLSSNLYLCQQNNRIGN